MDKISGSKNANPAPSRRYRALRGVSLLALAGGALYAAPVAAQQATPGSAECPIDAATGTVTCTGNIPGGFHSPSTSDVRRVVLRDLTVPIVTESNQPTIEVVVRDGLDRFSLDLDSTVQIRATNPQTRYGTRPRSAVYLTGRSNMDLFSINTAADIDITGGGAFMLGSSTNLVNQPIKRVEFTNSGNITGQWAFQMLTPASGLGIADFATEVDFTNTGTITLRQSNESSVILLGRDINVVNRGDISIEATNVTSNARAFLVSALTKTDDPARIVFENYGNITGRFVDGTAHQYRSPSFLSIAGHGTIDLLNRGALTAAGFTASASSETGKAVSIAIDNNATLTASDITANASSYLPVTNRAVHDQTSASIANARIINSGRINDSYLSARAFGINSASASIDNSADLDWQGDWRSAGGEGPQITRSLLSVEASSLTQGTAVATLSNAGDIRVTRADNNIILNLLAVSSSGDVTIDNSGDIVADGPANFAGIYARQFGNGLRAPSTSLLSKYYRGDLLADFGAPMQIANRGNMHLTGADAVVGILVNNAMGTLNLTNSGVIQIGRTAALGDDSSINADPSAGLSLHGFGNILVENNAAITVVSDANWGESGGVPAAGIFFSERSLSSTLFDTLRIGGELIRGGGGIETEGDVLKNYDRTRDLESLVHIRTNANITATGADAHGIMGLLGMVTQSGITEIFRISTTGDEQSFPQRWENDRASALIEVSADATVQGGSGRGNGISAQGGGRVTVHNDGEIRSNGDERSAAIFLGNVLTGEVVSYTGFISIREGASNLSLHLADSVNTGRIVSGTGQGILVQTGGIDNFVNRGLIQGGVASIRSAGAASIDNQAGGVIDGRLMLEGAGSSLVNASVVRATGQGYAAHSINGDYTQLAGGALVLRSGANGRDTFAVTGDMVLAGDLNLALGAPSTDAFITVGGDLSLGGRLNVTDAGGFGQGVYRIFDYAGTLTYDGLTLGALPNGASGEVQTSIARQVNLVVGSAGPGPVPGIQFWNGSQSSANGTISGGSGTWDRTATNWTDANGTRADAWGSRFAVFQGAAGTVTIAPEGVSASGLQFVTNGYRVEGGSLTLTAPATVRVGDGTQAGAATSATIAAAITGDGGLDKTDFGTLILTGANSYTGGSRVSGGVLQVSSDTALGATSGGVTLDGGTLRSGGAFSSARNFAFGANGGVIDTQGHAITLSGVLSGGGSMSKTGSGALTLSGDSRSYAGPISLDAGTLNLTGALGGRLVVNAGTADVTGSVLGGARVNAGVLRVGGTVDGDVFIGANGTLRGTGRIGTLDLAGTLSPGNSPGTLTTTGDAIFRAGSFYDAELLANGTSDLLRVGGAARLEGGTVRVTTLDPETQYRDGTRYTILSAAGGLIGQFAGLTENSAFLDFALGYDANDAFLTVSVIRTFPEVAETYNQRQSSTALATFGAGGGDALAVYNDILMLDEAPARAALDAASGEIYAATLGSMLRRTDGEARWLLGQAWSGGAEGWGIWGDLSGQRGRVASDGNGARWSHDQMQMTLGVDYRGLDNRWAVGLGGGYWSGDVTVRDRMSRADSDGWHIGGYARYGDGGAGVSFALTGAYAQGDAEVDRTIRFGTLDRSASADADLKGWSLMGEARYGLPAGGGWVVGPLARIGHADGWLGGFAETGADSLNLAASINDADRTRYGGGLFARWSSGRGMIDVTAAYTGGNGATTEVELAMAGAAASPHRVRAARGQGEALELGLTGAYDLGRGWSLGVGVEAATGSAERYAKGHATLRLAF